MADFAADCPNDFNAVVITTPARVDMDSIDDLLSGASDLMAQLADFPGHRIVHARQIEQADSATIATLLYLARRAHEHQCNFVICDPPAVLDSYLDVYLPGDDRTQHIFYTGKDSPEECPVPWVPQFLASKPGRVDVWKQGQWHASYNLARPSTD